jgi:putative endonuclease
LSLPSRPKAPARQARGRAARLAGRRGEVMAALLLMLKGYRILGFRLKTPHGEIDLLAQRGRVLAVIEVKRRMSLDEARNAVTAGQLERLRRAGRALAQRRAGLKGCVVRLDLIALAKGTWPRHIANAWRQDDPR